MWLARGPEGPITDEGDPISRDRASWIRVHASIIPSASLRARLAMVTISETCLGSCEKYHSSLSWPSSRGGSTLWAMNTEEPLKVIVEMLLNVQTARTRGVSRAEARWEMVKQLKTAGPPKSIGTILDDLA